MLESYVTNTAQTTIWNAASFSLVGTPLSTSFDAKSGFVFGIFSGLSSLVLKPMTTIIF